MRRDVVALVLRDHRLRTFDARRGSA